MSLQRYFNRHEVYVRDIQIEEGPYGPRQQAEISFEYQGSYWTGIHRGKPSPGLQKGWNTVRFETVKVLEQPEQNASGVVQIKALKVLDTLWDV